MSLCFGGQPEADTGKLCSSERAQVFESDYIDSDSASDKDISDGEQRQHPLAHTQTYTHTQLKTKESTIKSARAQPMSVKLK